MTRPTLPSIPQYRIFTEHHFKSVDHHGENFMSSRFCHLNLKIVFRLFTGFQDWSMLGFYSYNWHFIVWPIQYQILTFKFQQCNYNQILNQLQINSMQFQFSTNVKTLDQQSINTLNFEFVNSNLLFGEKKYAYYAGRVLPESCLFLYSKPTFEYDIYLMPLSQNCQIVRTIGFEDLRIRLQYKNVYNTSHAVNMSSCPT